MKGIFTSPSLPLDFPDHLTIDFAAMTPHQYQKCLAENREKLSSISTVLLGGSSISDALEEEISTMPHTVFHSFGMTETYSHVALREVGKSHFFVALDQVSFSTNEQQCLQINAPHLGISNLLTNDLVDLLDEKRFQFLGRTDFVINSGGMKIHPEILEKKWSKYIKNQNFILSGRKDDLLGERLVMLLEGNNSLNLQPFKQFFAKQEIPKEVVSCERFAYTSSGKIDRITTQRKYLI
jgi:O-succinylbenzoic acid--CoA ligase